MQHELIMPVKHRNYDSQKLNKEIFYITTMIPYIRSALTYARTHQHLIRSIERKDVMHLGHEPMFDKHIVCIN